MSDVAPTIQIFKFVSSDNEEFLIPSNIIKMSVTVKNVINDLGLDTSETTNQDAIPLQNVDAKTLKKVIEWCTHHVNEPAPAAEEDAEEDAMPDAAPKKLSAFATEFFNVDQTQVFEIILAANYLDIKGLLDAGCTTIANMMKGLSPQEICDKFDIVNDFTPEEQENEATWTEE